MIPTFTKPEVKWTPFPGEKRILPDEVVSVILSPLSIDELIIVRAVTQQFFRVANHLIRMKLCAGVKEEKGSSKAAGFYCELLISYEKSDNLVAKEFESSTGYTFLGYPIDRGASLSIQNPAAVIKPIYKIPRTKIKKAIAKALENHDPARVAFFVKTWHELKDLLSKRLVAFNYRFKLTDKLVKLIKNPKDNVDKKIVKFIQLWFSSEVFYEIAKAEILEEQREAQEVVQFQKVVKNYDEVKDTCQQLINDWGINAQPFELLGNRLYYYLHLMTTPALEQLKGKIETITASMREGRIDYPLFLGTRSFAAKPIELTSEEIHSLASSQ